MPGGDLLLSQPYDVLMADVLEAKHIGRGVIDGVECEHLAFRNFDTDWQLWVEAGDQPIPRKLVITGRDAEQRASIYPAIKSWTTGVELAPDAFLFSPPEGARVLGPDELIGLDELPQAAPIGDSQ